jgi:hypothetical protein
MTIACLSNSLNKVTLSCFFPTLSALMGVCKDARLLRSAVLKLDLSKAYYYRVRTLLVRLLGLTEKGVKEKGLSCQPGGYSGRCLSWSTNMCQFEWAIQWEFHLLSEGKEARIPNLTFLICVDSCMNNQVQSIFFKTDINIVFSQLVTMISFPNC